MTRLGVHEGLGGDTPGAGDPSWPKGCSTPCGVTLTNKTRGKVGQGLLLEDWLGITPLVSNCSHLYHSFLCFISLSVSSSPPLSIFFFFLRERWLWSWLWWWGVAGEAGSWIHTACCLRQGRWEHHSLRGPVTLKDRQLCFVLPIVNFIPYGVRMTFNFFEMKICANMVSNSHIQCDIYFYIRSKYERILMYWSGHFHLII